MFTRPTASISSNGTDFILSIVADDLTTDGVTDAILPIPWNLYDVHYQQQIEQIDLVLNC